MSRQVIRRDAESRGELLLVEHAGGAMTAALPVERANESVPGQWVSPGAWYCMNIQ
jgi:hypothetical protein